MSEQSKRGESVEPTENVKEMNAIRYLLPDKLAYIAIPKSRIPALQKELGALTTHVTCISSDLHTRYLPLGSDFGPVNLGVVYRFCRAMVKKMSSLNRGYFCEEKKAFVSVRDGAFVYCIEPDFKSIANACFLLGAFLIIEFQMVPQEVAAFFVGPAAPFEIVPFRDITSDAEASTITLLDCFLALRKAVALGWFDVRTFKVETYETLDNPLCGDIHQICPKFVAFRCPRDVVLPDDDAFETTHCVDILKQLGVTCVVRLAEFDAYSSDHFTNVGIQHHDLPCPSPFPSDDTIERFLTLIEKEALVAVHCRTGLGRTGTLVALWLMRHSQFTSREAVAWVRIVRTGSISAAQQDFLARCEARRWIGPRLAGPLRTAPPIDAQPSGEAEEVNRNDSPFRPVDPECVLDDEDEPGADAPSGSAAEAATVPPA